MYLNYFINGKFNGLCSQRVKIDHMFMSMFSFWSLAYMGTLFSGLMDFSSFW